MGVFGLGGDNGASAFKASMGQAAESLKRRGTMFDDIGNVAGADAAAYRPQVSHFLGLLSGMVNQGNTDTGRSRFVNNATANVTGAYNAAKANLTADMAARGITDSSLTAGGLAGIEGQRAGTFATAENNANQYLDDQRYSRTSDLVGLLHGLYSDAQSRQLGATSAGAGIDQGLFSGYGNLYGEAQRENADETGQALGLISTVGAGAGWFGGRGKGK